MAGLLPTLAFSFKETNVSLPRSLVKNNIVGSLREQEVVCSASDCQGSNFEFCVGRVVSSHSFHHPQDVLMAQFSLYVHKGSPIHFFNVLLYIGVISTLLPHHAGCRRG